MVLRTRRTDIDIILHEFSFINLRENMNFDCQNIVFVLG